MLAFECGGRTVHLVATGNLREAASRRLGGGADASGRAADLRGVTERLAACVCGSVFESEAAFLEIARSRAPRTYQAAADRWRGWFLRLDPESDVPVWRKTDLRDLLAGSSGVQADPGTLIGPIANKDAAARYGRLLDDLFELCREPKLLAQRPHARACSYKEMGRCPAPCDGSEPMEAYRGRVREAVRFARGGPEAAVGAIEAEMLAAAGRAEFEVAAELRVRGELAGGAKKPAFSRVTTLDRFDVLAVCPAGRKGWARLIRLRRGELAWLGDARAEDAGAALGLLEADGSGGAPPGLTVEAADRIGLLSSWAYRKGRSAVSFLSLDRRGEGDEEGFGKELLRATRRAGKIEAEAANAEAGEAEAGDVAG